MAANFGVAITTLDRRRTFQQTLNAYKRLTPPDVPILVIDDGSDIPVPGAHHRNHKPTGVAAAKNDSLRLLMDTGVDHLFLSDDDVFPTSPDWWKPFIEAPWPHLIYQPREVRTCMTCKAQVLHVYHTRGGDWACTVCTEDVRPEWENDTYFAPHGAGENPNAAGVLLYVRRDVVDRVGGMRPEFGRWSCETWEWSCRIQNVIGKDALPYPFISPKASALYSVDANSYGPRSSVPPRVRDEHRERNWQMFLNYRDSTDFVPLRDDELPPVTVCRPWRATPERVCGHDRALKYWIDHGYNVVEADSDPNKPFLCAEARNNAARLSDTDIIIMADADTVPDKITQIEQAVKMVANGEADMVYPYTTFHHIDESAAHLPDYTKARVQQEYWDSPGGIFVLSMTALERFGWFDENFVPGELSFDDTSFRYACDTLGTVKRVPGIAWSFNHRTRADGRPDRDYSDANLNKPRFRLYQAARGNPDKMRELVFG